MTGYKRVLGVLLLTAIYGTVTAQNNTNSPYTRYGFGQLSDQSFGNSRAMGGMAYGLRDGSQINASNPASYTAIDSLTFIFDGGMTFQNTNFSDGNSKTNAKNTSFDYIAMQFRLNRRFAVSAGFLPFSNVGYNFNSQEIVNDPTAGGSSSDITATHTFTGEGGLHQVYAGIGFKIINNLSVGANVSYLFGNIKHTVETGFSQTGSYYFLNQTSLRVRDYKADFGLQYTQKIGSKHTLNIGAVYSLGHSLNTDAYHYLQSVNSGSSSSSVVTSRTDTLSGGFSLPHSFGAGFTYVYDKRLTIGFDYTLQKWADAEFEGSKNHFCDRTKYAVGVEFQPNPATRKYFGRVKYRAGAYYSDPYILVKGEKGAREYGISAGFSLPVFNSKSLLNISGQYVKVSPQIKGMLEEQYLKLSVGLTFNERWFMKWKVE